MPKTITFIIVVFAIRAGFSQPAVCRADIAKIGVSCGLERLEGITLYQIGGHLTTPSSTSEVRFPLSELKFPLDSYLGSLRFTLPLTNRLLILLDGKMDIARTGSETMKDSDWLDTGTTSTISSESDADVTVRIWRAELGYKFLQKPRYSLQAGVGYIHQDFRFDVGNTRQISSISGYDTGYYPGSTLVYDITYTIPYFTLGAVFKANSRFSLHFSLGYSPCTKARDKDRHLITRQKSKGNCDGDTFLGNIQGRYLLTDHWSARLRMNYRCLNTDGRSATYDSREDTRQHTLDQKTESRQVSLCISAGYRF